MSPPRFNFEQVMDTLKLAEPPEVKTRDYLDQPRRCANPMCRLRHRGADFVLVSICHPDIPPMVRYVDGILHFFCKICARSLDQFKVAQS